MAINVPTRGEPPEYQQVGYLTGESGEEDTIKPLLEDRLTEDQISGIILQVWIHLSAKFRYMNDKDCTDERGCGELQKGSTVTMGEGGVP